MTMNNVSKRVSAKTFLPSKEALLFEEPWPDGKRQGANNKAASIVVSAYANNSVELEVNMPERGVLVASESWYPGWKGYVDGAGKNCLKPTAASEGLPLTAGKHVVRFAYRPAFPLSPGRC